MTFDPNDWLEMCPFLLGQPSPLPSPSFRVLYANAENRGAAGDYAHDRPLRAKYKDSVHFVARKSLYADGRVSFYGLTALGTYP